MLTLCPEQRTPCDLDALSAHAETLHPHNRATFTAPLPNASHRWLAHAACTPHPIALPSQGAVDGGRRWLVGVTLAWRVTRSLWATAAGTRGGSCDDPARLVFLAVAATGAPYTDDAQWCRALHDRAQGRRSRLRAGRHGAVPGEADLGHFRDRIGEAVIAPITAVAVAFLSRCGLSKGAWLSTDGPRAPSASRSQGCPYACQRCHAWPLEAAGRQALWDQWHSGATRLQRPCPFADVVHTVRAATAQQGTPRAPKVSWRALEAVCDAEAAPSDGQQVASLLGLPADQGPPVRLTWCHGHKTPPGARLGSCPKGPSDLAAQLGDHLDTKDPAPTAPVFGDGHLPTTDLHRALGLALPLGTTPEAAAAQAGPEGLAHRATLARPVVPGQVPRGDAAHAGTANDGWLRAHGGSAVCASHRRHAHLAPEALRKRGEDHHRTPSAPCGRLCHSHGDDSQAQSRQDVCGLPCPPHAPRPGPHRFGVLGSSHRMRCTDPPRLIGPMQRGTPVWPRLSAARSASERPHSATPEGSAKAHPLRMRGLKAFRCAGAMRTLAQLGRRALHFVLDAT